MFNKSKKTEKKTERKKLEFSELEHLRNRISILLGYIIFALGCIFSILATFNPSNIILGAYLLTLLGLGALFLLRKKLYAKAFLYEIIGSLILLTYMSYYANSAYTLSVTPILLIISGIFLDRKYTKMLFTMILSAMVIFLIIGKFTVKPTFLPGSEIALVNNVQVLLVLLILSYLLSFIISKFFLRSIEHQRKQNIKIKDTQEKLISQAKMDSITLMAGGFAHDFNNILTVITGNISFLETFDDISKEQQECIHDIKNASKQARNLANQLLSFTKHSEPIKKEVENLVELIETTAKFSLSGRKSKFVIDYNPLQIPSKSFGLFADPDQISQVFQNLLINADQSMKNGGIITISLTNVELGAKNTYNLDKGRYIHIQVVDQGEGIPETHREKIFNMFFTTKNTGSGLGLAICKNIIINHNGYINFSSKVGVGTIFDIFLPEITSTFRKFSTSDSQIPQKYTGTVLIYDDNRQVIGVLESILKKLGLTPHSASESSSFLSIIEQFEKLEQKIDLFIIDLTVPGDTSGKDMIKILRQRGIEAKVIVSSGYSDELILHEFSKYHIDEILKKPYYFDEVKIVLEKIFQNK